jgi:hypothetical protein
MAGVVANCREGGRQMISILRILAQDEALLASLDGLLERNALREQTHGVALAFDDSWLSWATLFLSERYRPYPVNCSSWSSEDWLFFDDHIANVISDLVRSKGPRPAWWSRHCIMRGYREDSVPVIVKVVVREPGFDPSATELPATLESGFGTHPIVYEYRPIAVAVSMLSSAIGLRASGPIGHTNPPKTGTLGGFLKNIINNQLYAVTCAHVLPRQGGNVVYPGPSRSSHSATVGTVDFRQLPPPNLGSQLCNNRSTFTNNQLDVALASIDQSRASALPQAGYPAAVLLISQMSTGQKVKFYGQKSKAVSAKIDDVNIWRTICIDGQDHCFGDIFSIVSRNTAYLNRALARPGDSGSWVISDGSQPPAWAGMVIADDGLKAYCCFSEHIIDRLSSHFGVPGSCVLP